MQSLLIRASWLALTAAAAVGCSRASASTPTPESRGAENLSTGFAVVELFTSEGCSSCPPADDVLRELASEATRTGRHVYPLAFHVDYWNGLGWPDPYSSGMATTRQQTYSRALGEQGVYTPEIIINGRDAFVGSNRTRAHRSIEAAVSKPEATHIVLHATRSDGGVSVDFASIRTVDDVSAKVADAPEKNGERMVTLTAQGDLWLHGVSTPKTIKLSAAFQGPASAPTGLHIVTAEPLRLSLKEHDIKPRDLAGKFLNGALEKDGKKIDDEVQISLDLTACNAKS